MGFALSLLEVPLLIDGLDKVRYFYWFSTTNIEFRIVERFQEPVPSFHPLFFDALALLYRKRVRHFDEVVRNRSKTDIPHTAMELCCCRTAFENLKACVLKLLCPPLIGVDME